MSRIGKAYEARFHALLLRLKARRLEQGVAWLLAKAKSRSPGEYGSRTTSLRECYVHLRNQIRRFEQRTGKLKAALNGQAPRFLCDAGLGGLARWLRAAGYEAIWNPELDDAALLRETVRLHAFLLTTDSLMMERGILRDGFVPALWLPPTGGCLEQLSTVLRELDLPIRAPRCMHCGGELRSVQKESMRDRIPPKTWLWIDEYFLCADCGQLFWRGTHWQRIQSALDRLKLENSPRAP